METEKNEKVLAIYHAVWTLLDEGRDLHRIKVSDITECAGIGKGTAYEYFRSKEEIVGKAMRYNCLMQFHMLKKRIDGQDSYRKVLETCFDWMTETQERRRLVMEFFRKSEDFPEPSGCLRKDGYPDASAAAVIEILHTIVQLGRKEGQVRKELSDRLAAIQILAQLLGFFAYQEIADSSKEKDIAMTKEFLCDNIIKSLC